MAIEVGSLLIDMRADVARLSQDMDKVRGTVDSAMASVTRAAGAAATALGLIGAGAAVAGLVSIVKHSVDALSALDDMAAVAGTTTEKMSALADIAQIGGHQIGTVESTMVRLTKALAGGDDEARAAGHALEALGLNAEKLRGMDTADAMLQVALALDKYGDSAGKTALLQDLLGKSGAAALPFLQDLAQTGQLNATVTSEQSAAAEQLQKDLNAVKLEGDKMQRAMVADWLPAIGGIAKAMRLAAEEGGTLKALFVGFGGIVKTSFTDPWGKAIDGLRASMAMLMADMERGLAAVTFGDTKARHIKAAAMHDQAAKDILRPHQAPPPAPPQPKEEKPTLDYNSAAKAKAGGAGAKKSYAEDERLAREIVAGEEAAAQETTDAWKAWEKIVLAQTAAADKVKDLVDPYRAFGREVENINRLREAGLLTADEAAARERQLNNELQRSIDKLSDVRDTGKDAFKGLENAIESWGNKAADVFADFVVDGKGSFNDLINAMLKDIARLQAKSVLDPLTKGASNWITDSLRAFNSPGYGDVAGLAAGVPQYAQGTPYVPEDGLAYLHKGERVLTAAENAAGASAAPITVNITNHIDSRSDLATIQMAMVQAQRAAVAAIGDAQRRGR